jgi:hypothetical protein
MSTERGAETAFLPLTDGAAPEATVLHDTSRNPDFDASEDAPTSLPPIVKLEQDEDEVQQAMLHANGGPIVQKDYVEPEGEGRAVVPLKEEESSHSDFGVRSSPHPLFHAHLSSRCCPANPFLTLKLSPFRYPTTRRTMKATRQRHRAHTSSCQLQTRSTPLLHKRITTLGSTCPTLLRLMLLISTRLTRSKAPRQRYFLFSFLRHIHTS